MGKAIAIFNQKGGVGKTTTNINLAASLAMMGKKILVLDIDPQGNTTSGLGVAKKGLRYTTYELLVEDGIDVKDTIMKTSTEGLYLIPASVQLAGAEVELVKMDRREKRLKKALDIVKEQYDYIFIDCPPSLGLLTINSLTAVDSVLIPIQCEFYALEGVSQLMHTIDIVRKNLNPTQGQGNPHGDHLDLVGPRRRGPGHLPRQDRAGNGDADGGAEMVDGEVHGCAAREGRRVPTGAGRGHVVPIARR